MAKKKSSKKSKPRAKPVKMSPLGQFFRFIRLRPVRWFVFMAAIVGVLYWQREPVFSWLEDTYNSTIITFGLGAILILIAISP